MMKSYEVKLDVEKELYSPSQVLFSVSKNDLDSIGLFFEIIQDGEPFDLTGKTVELGIKKPSGKSVFQTVEITNATDGKASANLSIQAHVEFGIHSAEIYIRDANQMIVTSPFYFVSRESVMDTNEIPSVNDWGALQQALFLYDRKPILTDGVPTIIPEYAGQTALDTVNKLFFVANDTTADSWVPIGSGGEGGTGVVSWESILNKPVVFPSEPHAHIISDVIGLQTALDGKKDAGDLEPHGHTIADVEQLQETLDAKVDDAELDEKANVEHKHSVDDVEGLQIALDGKADDGDSYTKDETYNKTEVYNKTEIDQMTMNNDGGSPVIVEDNLTSTSTTNALSSNQGRILDQTKADADHVHTVEEVTGLQTALDGKVDDAEMDGKADVNHLHGWGEIQDKPTSFPPDAHVHDYQEIANKPTSFPPDAHVHGIADVTGLQETLDSKAGAGHTHGWEQITDKPTTFTPPVASTGSIGGVQVGNGLRMVNQYLTIREGFGIIANPTTSAIDVDTTDLDSRYASQEQMGGLSLWKGTQAEYDAIATKDPNKLYFIV